MTATTPLLRAVLVAAALAATLGAAGAAEIESDFILRRVPAPPGASPPSRFQPEFEFLFGSPTRWPGSVLHWGYNPAGAPFAFANTTVAVQKIGAAAAKWSAVCGIHFVYDGETTVPPYDGTSSQPDHVNVVGWRTLTPGVTGVTYGWYGAQGGSRVLVDTDIVFDLGYIVTDARMDRTASHEWGHAIGIAHSNVSGALLSGIPDSPYSSEVDPQPDDVRACRCLYGAAVGQQAAYACTLPPKVDFGIQTVGADSAPMQITITNDSTATLPLTIGGTTFTRADYRIGATTCTSGIVLPPGAGCTMDLIARPLFVGKRAAEAMISTSDGLYSLPLTADVENGPTTVNYQGLWWKSPGGSEDGWGINFAHQGETIFGTWFTYDATGKGWWLTLIVDDKATPGVYTGNIFTTTGPPFNAVPFIKPGGAAPPIGTATLTFTDADNGNFAYVIGAVSQTKAITRQPLGGASFATCGTSANLAASTNYQDIWWAGTSTNAGTEQGWGINFAHQGDIVFASWFTYNLDGAPLWLAATAPKIAPGVYKGDLYQPTGPPFNAYDKSQYHVNASVGTLTLFFADGNNAAFDYTVQLAGMANSVTHTKIITRQLFSTAGTSCK